MNAVPPIAPSGPKIRVRFLCIASHRIVSYRIVSSHIISSHIISLFFILLV